MSELTREELIGAYLDGELSSEEKARTEQLLAESAENRQMLEELRALRANLQALPRHTLPADFSQRVIQRAEREMLLGSPVTAATRATVAGSEMSAPATVPFGNRWVRPLVYAGFAVAAALLIAVVIPQNGEEGTNLAVRETDDGAIETPAIPTEEQIATTSDRQAGSESIAKNAPAPVMAPTERSVPAIREGTLAAPKSAPASSPESEPAALAASEDDLLIVDLQITQSALTRGEFQQLLQAAEIEVASAAPPAPAAEADMAEESSPETVGLEAKARAAKENHPGTTPLPTDAEMFYVEATSEQLEAALAEIDTKNADFPALVIEPAAGMDIQRKWRMEFRRIPASAQSEVAEDELNHTLRHEVGTVLQDASARDEALAVEQSEKSTARRIDPATSEADAAAGAAPTKAQSSAPGDPSAAPRMRAVFVLRVVADEEPAPTQTPPGVD